MTKNDFSSPLHKERQVQGHSCWGRLMVLPDVGTPQRVTSPWCSSALRKRTKQPAQEHGKGMDTGSVDSSLHTEWKIAWKLQK